MNRPSVFLRVFAGLCVQNALLVMMGFVLADTMGKGSPAEAVGDMVVYSLPLWALVWIVGVIIHYARRSGLEKHPRSEKR